MGARAGTRAEGAAAHFAFAKGEPGACLMATSDYGVKVTGFFPPSGIGQTLLYGEGQK
jgi:hypothetical protein